MGVGDGEGEGVGRVVLRQLVERKERLDHALDLDLLREAVASIIAAGQIQCDESLIQNGEKNGPLAGWMQAARKVVSEWRSIGEETPEPIAEYPHADEVSTGEEKSTG